MPLLQAFDRGLNTRVDAHLIAANEAVIFENINSDTAILAPIKGNTVDQESIARYSYYDNLNDVWRSEATPTDWLEYQERLYKSDRINPPTKFVNNVEYTVGIEKPVSAPSVSATSAPDAIARADFVDDNDAGADLPPDDYRYKILNRSTTTNLVSF